MKKSLIGSGLLTLALVASPVASQARDDINKFPIAEAIASDTAKVDSKIALFWGDAAYPKPLETYGIYTSNKKTNAFNKTAKDACTINLLSAIISLQDRARSEGGNAVVNIHSVYKNDDFSSETEFECGSGAFVSGVALRGQVVKLP